MTSDRPCIFGEVLYDHFPDGTRVLGGAPFNVAWHLQAFGARPLLISRVGDDAEGEAIRAAMKGWGMDLRALQTDPERPTGRVSVSFHDDEPAYDIVANCAYDAIEAAAVATTLVDTSCRFLYHGSLALRTEASRGALRELAAATHLFRFVDVNLRSPWWSREQVVKSLGRARWAKLNEDELTLLAIGVDGTAPDPARFLRELALEGLLVTRGAAGAELHTADNEVLRVRPDRTGQRVDTVGAGDAFAAVMLLGLMRQWPLDRTLRRAQEFASRVVGHRGATVSDPGFYKPLIDQWGLAQRKP